MELLEQGLIDNAARMGAHMMDRMREWPGRYRHVGEVRGLGLMIGIELVKDQGTREPFADLRDRILDSAFERGVLVLGAGDSTVRLSPPLTISRDQCDFAMDVLEQCLKEANT
jgi:4-aminobutyrate aminotransferase